MNLARWLDRIARADARRPALYLGTDLLADYATLAQRVASLAAGLRGRMGLATGDRVGLFMTNEPAFLEILFACWWAGLAVVPINPKLHPREVQFILEHSQARLVFVSGDLDASLVSEDGTLPLGVGKILAGAADHESLRAGGHLPEPMDCRGEELAWLFYTSGTTGRPKGVMLTHQNLMAMTLCYFSDVDAAQPEDAVLYAAPMSHGAGLYGLPHVLVGARHVVPRSRGFDAGEILDLAMQHQRVMFFAAPTMVRRLVDRAESKGLDGEGIKTIVYGGGPMYVADIQRAVRVMGQRFVQIYGQGESPMTITALSRHHIADTAHPRHVERLGSVGLAQSGVEVRVADAGGCDLACGEVGEVLVRGSTVMPGYWRDPEATARAVRSGWLWTGDMGSLDQDGFLTLRDRSKDLIISGGSNIYPREVEEVLLRHPAIAEVAVVGQPDDEWGELVVAFWVPALGQQVDIAELDTLCMQNMARFKRPRTYRQLDSLPKNHYGKVLKTELRLQLARERAACPDAPSA